MAADLRIRYGLTTLVSSEVVAWILRHFGGLNRPTISDMDIHTVTSEHPIPELIQAGLARLEREAPSPVVVRNALKNVYQLIQAELARRK
jgi:hypothetical protein